MSSKSPIVVSSATGDATTSLPLKVQSSQLPHAKKKKPISTFLHSSSCSARYLFLLLVVLCVAVITWNKFLLFLPPGGGKSRYSYLKKVSGADSGRFPSQWKKRILIAKKSSTMTTTDKGEVKSSMEYYSPPMPKYHRLEENDAEEHMGKEKEVKRDGKKTSRGEKIGMMMMMPDDTTRRIQLHSSSSSHQNPTRKNKKNVGRRSLDSSSSSKPTTMILNWSLARPLYLPITPEAKKGFLLHEEKQRNRLESDPVIQHLWNAEKNPTAKRFIKNCLQEVPECAFFKVIDASILYKKCCIEHSKMKKALFYVFRVAKKYQLNIFLDSGTLLSSARDGGMTLLPWETDIDLGYVGAEPAPIVKAFQQEEKERKQKRKIYFSKKDKTTGEKKESMEGTMQEEDEDGSEVDSSYTPHIFYFSPCLTKISKNASRHGRCRDAHYIYYASSKEEGEKDTSRVEIWPFWPEPYTLIHPTRKKLSINTSVVLPLRDVFFLSAGKKTEKENRKKEQERSEGPKKSSSNVEEEEEKGKWRQCQIWGHAALCPNNVMEYLNHEYGYDESWRVPKTIHWGKNNVLAWRKEMRKK